MSKIAVSQPGDFEFSNSRFDWFGGFWQLLEGFPGPVGTGNTQILNAADRSGWKRLIQVIYTLSNGVSRKLHIVFGASVDAEIGQWPESPGELSLDQWALRA